MLKRVFLISLYFLVVAPPLFSDEPHQLEKIVVTPSRLPAQGGFAARSVTIIDGSIPEASIYTSIPDTIGAIGGIDIRRRGPEGVQADINIRGTTFEQNSVLIDGVRVNDPQTGHFNLDLPLTLEDIERIEILKGPASSIYGPNSFGGVINVITKRPEADKVTINSSGGSYDYFDINSSVSSVSGPLTNRFSIEEKRSTGYMPETEFNIFSLSNTSSLKTLFGIYDFFFGFLKKDFGADSFYSNLFSNEEEHTDTRFFKIDGEIEKDNLRIEPKLFLRRHRDKFMLDTNRPGWQTNYHTTYDYGIETNFVFEHPFMDVSYGFEVSRDRIDSTNLQTHKRDNLSLFTELSPKILDDLYLNIGIREDHFSSFGWECSPSVSAGYRLSDQLTVRGSAGRSYRIPTFTDLYYGDSANIGNSALRPESAWSYEAGMDYKIKFLELSATYFHRDTYDTIDWTRPLPTDPWRASNIGSVRTNGFELSLSLKPVNLFGSSPVKNIFFDYTTLDSYNKHDYLSKYALDYLKQHMTAGLEYEFMGFRNSWVINYKKRIGDSGFVVADTRVSKNILDKKGVILEAYLDISNIFDIDYSEQSNVPMPGRWIKSGVKFEF
ncbi:MAG: TonB-dependent receptor [Candidatus Omnitrophica bacterium]|nr:TonB-dependent receptor [Candidatus Omnitrophota bacterium]